MLERQPQSQVSSVQDLKFPNPTHTQMSMCKDWMVSSTCPLWKLWTRWSSFTSPMVEVCWVPGLNAAIWSSPTSTTTQSAAAPAESRKAYNVHLHGKNSKKIKKDQVILKLAQTYSILQLSQVSSPKRKILFSNKPWSAVASATVWVPGPTLPNQVDSIHLQRWTGTTLGNLVAGTGTPKVSMFQMMLQNLFQVKLQRDVILKVGWL